MAKGLPEFLEGAREFYGDPSISGGQSVHDLGDSKESTLSRFRSSGTGIDRGLMPNRVTGLRAKRKMAGLPKEPSVEKTTDGAARLQPIFDESGEQIGLKGSASTKKGLPGAPKKTGRPTIDFGLPTDRMPSFTELGGAIGQMFKYVSNLSKFNKARGLTPGMEVKKTNTGLTKARLTTLAKLHETATLAGDSEKASKIEAQLNAIMRGEDAGAFGVDADLEEIESL